MVGRLLATGAGGFIGHHLARYLLCRVPGHDIDIRPRRFEPSPGQELETVTPRHVQTRPPSPSIAAYTNGAQP
jgi:nucleoside-diphosphate-sugar epimerase